MAHPTAISILLILLVLFSCNHENHPKTAKNNTPIAIGNTVTPNFSNGVSCAYLDDTGILWIGSHKNGLYSYNGQEFAHYTQHHGLCNTHISCIAEDNEGNIWLGTANGLCKYNRQTFTHIPIPYTDTSGTWLDMVYPTVNPNEVQAILQDKQGTFWLGTNGAGAYRYDGKTFTNYLSDIGKKQVDSLYHNIIQSISEDSTGNIWFTSMTHGGISQYDGTTFTQFLPKNGLSDDMVRTSYVDSKGIVWFGFNGNRNSGLNSYNGQSFSALSKEDGLCNTNIRAIYEARNGDLWLGSGRAGICIYDGSSFREFTNNDGQSFSNILFIVEDANQHIWFGGTNGLWRYDGETVIEMTYGNR